MVVGWKNTYISEWGEFSDLGQKCTKMVGAQSFAKAPPRLRHGSATSAYTVPMKLLGFNQLVNAPVMEML